MLDKVDKYINYIILAALVIVYFLLQTIIFDKPILELLTDYKSILHLVFTIFSNVIVISIAHDHGLEKALTNDEFIQSNKDNNTYITYFVNNYELLIEFVDKTNETRLKEAQKNFLLNIGKKDISELNRRELRKYKRIKPITYSTKGITLPLYFKTPKGNVINYDVSYDPNGNKKTATLKKVVLGLLSGFMTINVAVSFGNVGDAITATIMLVGLFSVNYFFNYRKPIFRLTKQAPKKVGNKAIFYETFKTYIEKNTLPIPKQDVEN